MKWVLGDVFTYKLNKPRVPTYIYKKYEYENGLGKKIKYKKKLSLYNIYVYLYLNIYIKNVYKFFCSYIFPVFSFFNKILVKLLKTLFKTNIFYNIYSIVYSIYIFVLKVLVRHFTNINGLRFLFYVLMVDVNFRAPSCQMKDFFAKKFGLTTNNEQPAIDYYLEEIINSYLNFGITDTKVDFLASKKRNFLSFFLLYQEKERIVISNKLFLEASFLFLSSLYQKNSKKEVLEHKKYLWKRLVYLVSISQRIDLKILLKLVLFIIKKFILFFSLIVIVPFCSIIFQFVFLPIIQSLVYFYNLIKLFIKEIFNSLNFFCSFIYKSIFYIFDIFRVLFYILKKKETSYDDIVLFFNNKTRAKDRKIVFFIKLLFIPFYKIYYYLPSKNFLKGFFVEYVVKRSIEPTLQNGDDGFLFMHKQKSVFNNKTREFMDSEILDFILSTEDLKYWEFDMEDQIEKKEEERAENLFKEYINPAILEQEEDDDEEEEYDFEEDFWLMETNSSEDDGFVDLIFLYESFKGFLFSFPILNYFVILVSALYQGYFRVWLRHRLWLPFGYLDMHQHDSVYIGPFPLSHVGHKLWNVFYWLAVGFCLTVTSFFVDHWAFVEERRFPIYMNSVKMIDIWVPSIQNYLSHCIHAGLILWLCYYITEWIYVSDRELAVEDEREDTAYLEEEEYEISEDFAIFIFIYCSYIFLSSSAWNLIVHPMRYLEQTPMLYRNHNLLDLVCNVHGYLEYLLINFYRVIEYIISFIIG